MKEESLHASQTDRNLLTPPNRQECLRSSALGGSPHPQSFRDSSRPRSSVRPTRRRSGSLRSGSAPPPAEARPVVLAPPAARAEFWDRHGNATTLACRPLRPPAGSCGPGRQALLPGSFLHSFAPGRPLGPTGDRGSGLVRWLSGDWASVVVAEPARASREQTNEDGDEPAARSKKNGPESRREKPGSGGRQFGVVNKVYSKQRGS